MEQQLSISEDVCLHRENEQKWKQSHPPGAYYWSMVRRGNLGHDQLLSLVCASLYTHMHACTNTAGITVQMAEATL